jgi:uncharacterized protein
MSVQAQQIASILDGRYLNLIVLPTEKCNFRCTYCYEDFEIGRMAPAVVKGVQALLRMRAPTLDALEISWFGVEPLVAQDVVEDISRTAVELATRYASLAYKANITTNGSLLDIATAERLVGLGVTFFQISLDGPQQTHDLSRVRANGMGSFAQIWSNLVALRDSDLRLSIMLRVHFSPDTFEELAPLVDDINDEFAEDERFAVYFKSIERLGGTNDPNIRVFGPDLKRLAKESLNARLRHQRQIYSYASDQPYVCYASRPNSLVIRADGSLGKCTVALRDERNNIGRLNPDGTIDVDQSKLRLWMIGLQTLDAQDLACPYSRMNERVKGKEGIVTTLPGKSLPIVPSDQF